MKEKRTKFELYSNYLIIFLFGFLFAIFYSPFSNTIQGNFVKSINSIEYSNSEEKSSTEIVAVSSNDNSGILGQLTVEITPGDGKILVNTNPFLEPDIQFSANIASEVAQKITLTQLGDHNLIYNFVIDSNVLGGSSAGGSMTVSTIAALLGKELHEDIVLTGTIKKDGSIGYVGGLLEKAEAVAKGNNKLFLVPKGQSILYYYEKEVKALERDGKTFYTTYYTPKQLDLKKYAKEELNLEIREVTNIYEVMDIMLK